MTETRDAPPALPSTVGPRTGSDPNNASQEIAVLRAEMRGLEGVVKERAAALAEALRVASETYQAEFRQRWDSHAREHGMIQEAVTKAEASVDKRLEAMNELRVQITTERASYLTRAVYETNHDALRQRVTMNTEATIKIAAELSGLREDLAALKSGQEWLVRAVVGAVLTGVMGLLFAVFRAGGGG
jgi:septal ring factor EnvC (AmiA/AmiB activator)